MTMRSPVRHSAQRLARRPLLFESLEARELLSISVMPPHVNVRSVNHGRGVATVVVLGDATLDASTIDVPSLVLTATPDGRQLHLRGTPRLEDVDGDGDQDLVMKFRRSELRGILGSSVSTVDVTIDVQG